MSRQTWLATDLEAAENSQVVVKLLALGGQVQWEDLRLFEREAKVMQQLNHPRLPRYRDYFYCDDRSLWFGLVLAYIPGCSLQELLEQQKRFTEQEICKLADEVLGTLIYLHELNPRVLHRDIKPSNLIWGEDGHVYLIDFGAVQDRPSPGESTFSVIGTYGYTPMEQFGGQAVPASDLYALGATLIHLLTGNAPADLLQKDLQIQFSDLVSVSPSLVRWIKQVTEPSLNRRFGTAREALKALRIFDPNLNLIFPPIIPLPTIRKPNLPTQKISQPEGTYIKINNSHDELSIEIPGLAAWKSTLLVSMLLIFLLYLIPVFAEMGLLYFCVTCLVLYWAEEIHKLTLPTLIHFNRSVFFIYKKRLGYEPEHPSGFTSTIESVFEDEVGVSLYSGSLINRIVIITTGLEEHYSGYGLRKDECKWLAQEIKDWLLHPVLRNQTWG